MFARDGLGASLGDVAQEAGVGVASIYRRFDNKNDLIQALLERRFPPIVERMTRGLTSDDPWGVFVDEFRQSAREYASDRGFRELVIGAVTGSFGWARGSEPDRLRDSLTHWTGQVESVIGQLIRRAQDAGALRSDVTGSVILQLSLAMQSIAGFGSDEDYDSALTVVIDGLRAR